MNEKEIIKDAMRERECNQTQLAQMAGLKRQSNVSELLRGNSIRVDNFVKFLTAMGYEVVVRDSLNPNGTEWVVENAK
ncbi:MAG: helix-turn-helix domain-containing protein [Clostridiales bacterium]|nr:helix-turn-helix domain-containing protein [Clostridiales bacterium]